MEVTRYGSGQPLRMFIETSTAQNSLIASCLLLTQLYFEDYAVRCKLPQPQKGLRVSASCAVEISQSCAAVALITDASLMHGVVHAVRCRVNGHATLDCAFICWGVCHFKFSSAIIFLHTSVLLSAFLVLITKIIASLLSVGLKDCFVLECVRCTDFANATHDGTLVPLCSS